MINGELLAMVARERMAELQRRAEQERFAASVRRRRPIRLRIIIEIEREPAYTTPRSASRSTW